MSVIVDGGKDRSAMSWINENHPYEGVFRVYWKDIKGYHHGGVTFNEEEGDGLRYEWYYEKGKMADGTSRGWWPKRKPEASIGDLKCEWDWKDGICHGKKIEYFENGNMREIGNIFNHRFEGEWKEYYSNGNLRTKRIYKLSVLNGKCSSYYDTGKLRVSGNYKHGMKYDRWVSYNKDGSIMMEKYFKYNPDDPRCEQPRPLDKVYTTIDVDPESVDPNGHRDPRDPTI